MAVDEINALPGDTAGNGTDSDMDPVTLAPSKTVVVDGKPVFKPSRSFLLAFGALCTITLAVAFDATTLSVALPIMSVELGGTALEAFWSGTSFLLASTVLQPTVASMSHIFGRKYLIYVTGALFAAGSIIGAVANNFTVILVGRTIQGIGGGGIIALTEVVVTDLVPLAFRGQWFSVLSAIWSIGSVTGPMIGAGFAQNVTWRWIFWINLPIIGGGLIMVVLFLNQAKIPGGIMHKLGRFDYIGSVLFTASSTAFLFGLTTGGVMYEWSSFRVIVPLVLGVVGMVGFGFYEIHIASEPIINKGIFNNWTMISDYIQTVAHGMILWSFLYFLVLYYQGVKFYSPITSSVALLPETLTTAPSAVVVGIIAGMTGHYRWSLWVGWCLTTLGCGLLYLLGPDTSVPAWIFLNIPAGLGTGMLFPAMGLSIQAACEPKFNAQAAAFFSFLRTFGQSVGVAISGVIFQNVFQRQLEGLPAYSHLAYEYSRDATAVVNVINTMPDTPERRELVVAYNDALHAIWLCMVGVAGFGTLMSFTVQRYSLNQEHVTQQGFVEKDKSDSEGPREVKDVKDIESGDVTES